MVNHKPYKACVTHPKLMICCRHPAATLCAHLRPQNKTEKYSTHYLRSAVHCVTHICQTRLMRTESIGQVLHCTPRLWLKYLCPQVSHWIILRTCNIAIQRKLQRTLPQQCHLSCEFGPARCQAH